MLPELGKGQQRAVTYLWAATQVTATVVRNAFIEIYSSLPDSGDGHTSIKDYCRLAGRSGVYLELLDEGFLTSALSGSPKDTAFLDLKVTRKMLEKVLAEKFDRGRYGKLAFEVRQLVYLRNDLCHQLLPSLPAHQYLACMQQLEIRLCTVTRLAALLAGAANPPEAALQHIHALFMSLVNSDDDLIDSTDQRPRTDSGTQADMHLATMEKGVQADTVPAHDPSPSTSTKENIDSPRHHARQWTSGNTKYDHDGAELFADSPDPGTPRRHSGLGRGGAVTHGIDAVGDGRRQGSQGCYNELGCRFTCSSKNNLLRHRDGTSVKGNKKVFHCHNTGHSFHRGELYGNGIMKHNTPNNHDTTQGFTTLSYTTVTMNHVPHAAHKGPCVTSILDVGLSLLFTVMLFLGVLSVTALPLASTISRLAVCGLYHFMVQANKTCRHLIRNLYSGARPRQAVCMTQVVFIPQVAPEEVHGPAMLRLRDENVGDFCKSGWKAGCRRKKRKNTRRMIN